MEEKRKRKREGSRETEGRVGMGRKDSGSCLFRRAGRERKRKRILITNS